MKRITIFTLVSLLSSGIMFGQGYYDDDIYYDASKAKQEKKEKKLEVTKSAAPSYQPSDFEAPVYQVYNNSSRDVDEYNRRGGAYAVDTLGRDTVAENPDVFEYTERIERFDNPDIIKSSTDENLKELYYANDVNIYVGTPSTVVSFDFFDPFSPWGYSSWAWDYYPYRYGYWGWNSWYYPYYRPYYAGWYDPFWGPGYWHRPYYPHYAWGGSAGRPPIRYSGNGRRPFGGTSGTHIANNTGRRPALNGYNSNRTTGRRPSSSSYRPNTNSNRYNQNNGSSWGGSTYNGYRGGSTNNNSYRNNNGNVRRQDNSFNYDSFRNNNNNSYRNSNTTRPSYNSTPSYRGGRSSSGGYRGGSSNGGGRGSFGGGGRGGRR